MNLRDQQPRPGWAGAGLLFISYVATAKAGLLLDPVGGFATLVWPPTGIAMAALFRWGLGLWPGVVTAAFLVNWSAGASWGAAAGIAAGNTLESVIAVVLLKRLMGFRGDMERVRDAVAFLAAAAAGVAVGASLGTFTLWAAGLASVERSAAIWKAWAVGDLLGALAVGPMILTWGTPSRRQTDWRPALEEGAFLACLAVTNGLVFLPPFDADPRNFLAAYLLGIPLFWAALRFTPSGAAAAILATMLFAVWGTAHGGGPFAQGPLNESLLFMQLFIATIAGSTLLLSAAAAERRRVFRDLQMSEERLRRSNRVMEASVREKETLLREVHHRVKNNLQTVYSLLNLQAGRVDNPAVLADLQDCRERVMSMALVHEKLYRSPDLARINFAEYLHDLIRRLDRSLGRSDGSVRVTVEAAPISLDVDDAIPCGLVVYELVSNALKHAFPDGRAGVVRVGFGRAQDGRVALSVEDDGAGMPPDADPARPTGLGLHLVNALAGQVDGVLAVERGNGTSFRLTFTAAPGAGRRGGEEPIALPETPAFPLKSAGG